MTDSARNVGKTGDVAWKDEYEMEIVGELSVADGTLYVGGRTEVEEKTGEAVVLAIDAETSDEKWRYTFGSTESDDIGPAATTPVVVGGKVYISTFPAGTDTDGRFVKDASFYALGSDDAPDDGNGDGDDDSSDEDGENDGSNGGDGSSGDDGTGGNDDGENDGSSGDDGSNGGSDDDGC